METVSEAAEAANLSAQDLDVAGSLMSQIYEWAGDAAGELEAKGLSGVLVGMLRAVEDKARDLSGAISTLHNDAEVLTNLIGAIQQS